MEKTTSFVLVFLVLTSCATISSFGAIAGSASTSTRGFSGTVEDGFLLTKIKAKITSMSLKNFSNITVSVSHNRVLLTGNIDSQENRLELIRNVWSVSGVKEVFNEIDIGRGINFSEKAEDFIFETKIENRLLFEPGIYSNNYTVDVVNGNVYVLGISSSIEEKQKLERFLQNMKDIKKLVILVDLLEFKNDKK